MLVPRFRVLLALGLAVLVGQLGNASAATVRPLALSELAARADRILVTQVVEVRTERSRARGEAVPVTLVTVRIERVLKGTAGGQALLEFLGGSVDGETLEIRDLPRFAVGDRDVLFLHGAPGGVSPLVGLMRGRFRVVPTESQHGERLAAHDGRPLVLATSGEPVSLAAFARVILAMLDTRDASRTLALDRSITLPSDSEGTPAAPPLALALGLGSSPRLFDGCPDWRCALESREWFRGVAIVSGNAHDARRPEDEAVLVEWGRDLAGYSIDTDTQALTVRKTSGAGRKSILLLNERLPWNSFDSAGARPSQQIDLPTVAGRELGLLTSGRRPTTSAPEGQSGMSSREERVRTSASVAPSRSSLTALADSACASGAAYLNPRLLTFTSPDHSMMSGYQVGFFQPSASAPAQVVDLPLTAFLTRRVIDLPPSAGLAMQSSLVADIRAAGLATPLDVVCTYRVRGVWPGGVTAWSESSQPFVRCGAAAAAR